MGRSCLRSGCGQPACRALLASRSGQCTFACPSPGVQHAAPAMLAEGHPTPRVASLHSGSCSACRAPGRECSMLLPLHWPCWQKGHPAVCESIMSHEGPQALAKMLRSNVGHARQAAARSHAGWTGLPCLCDTRSSKAQPALLCGACYVMFTLPPPPETPHAEVLPHFSMGHPRRFSRLQAVGHAESSGLEAGCSPMQQ